MRIPRLMSVCLTVSISVLVGPGFYSPPVYSIATTQMILTPQAALERLFTTPQLQAEWFTTTFLNQVPFPQIQQLIAEIQRDLGAYQTIQPDNTGFLITFERGQVAAQIALTDQGQISGLLFQPVSAAISLEEAIAQLQTLPGQVNFLVLENDSPIAALNADQPLGVGSAFKLAVLATLRQQIESGERSWDEVVELQPTWKSLPTGILQTWPDGSLVTLQTLATLMISISDNTATDALIHTLGQESIEALAGQNQPLLTTREFFTLKATQNQELLQRYRSADLAQRRQLLAEIADYPLPALDAGAQGDEVFGSGEPVALDIEYFFTPQELCDLMAQVNDLPLMSVNPALGLVNAAEWQRVAFKGGSEPGVLNLTHWLEATNGQTYCVSTTWNNPEAALDEASLYRLYGAVIQGLRQRNES